MDDSSIKTFYLKQFAKTSFFVFFAVIISKLLSYGYKITLARYFGPEIYGLYSLALIIIGVFVGLGSLGLSDGLTRYLSRYYEKKDYINANKLVKKAFLISLISSLLFGFTLYLSAAVISESLFHNIRLIYYLKVFAIALPFVILSNLLLSTIRARQKIKTYSFIVNISQNALKIIFLFLLILIGLNQKAVPVSYLLSTVGLFLLGWLFYKKYNKNNVESRRLKEEQFGNVLAYSWPIAIIGLLYGLLYWVDSLVIGYFEDAVLIGTYNVAITIISLFGIAPDLFLQLLFPFVSGKLALKKDQIIKDVSTQIIKWIFLINVPLFFILLVFPETVINLIFGQDFVSAAEALRILTISGIFTSFISIFTNLISALGKTRVILLWFIIFTIINFILGVALVPSLSLVGAAYATAISSTLFFIASFWYVKKQYSFYPITKKLFMFILFSSVLIGIFFLIEDYLKLTTLFEQFLFAVAFGGAYIIMIVVSRILNHDDLEIIRSTFKKILRRK